MKAVVFEKYGSTDVLEIKEVKKPLPKSDEVLIKIYATGVNAADWHLMRGEPFAMRLMGFGFLRPKHQILGNDISGIVEAIGENVKEFRVGDEVFGDLSADSFGGYAQYVCVKGKAIVLKPINLTFEEAAALPTAGVTALKGLLNYTKIKKGQKVLINGASGGVGTFAVQIAKAFGAEVTGVCSTKKMELIKNLGADKVIDYTKDDFTKNSEEYDVILACNGYHSIFSYKNSLSPEGVYTMTGGSTAQMFEAMLLGPLLSKFGTKKMGTFMMKADKKNLLHIKELAESGKIKPVIEKTYSLEEVPEAIKYIEEGHAVGKIVISIN